ncbi:hypothetical protein FCM35_KLT03779 [Carex littledalei]|uniref:Uncharacterized protein n=1 Tax=Carex littledalei TaxID=544730 RepID=A0A833QNF6_9POAL|nr:hypothetical protein FCM35_KLT03779 [Carex littledalei]
MAVKRNLHGAFTFLLLVLVFSQLCNARPLKEVKDKEAQPCEMDKTNRMERSTPGEKLADRYGPLVLNMLPRGSPVPPSGPGGGTNEIQN